MVEKTVLVGEDCIVVVGVDVLVGVRALVVVCVVVVGVTALIVDVGVRSRGVLSLLASGIIMSGLGRGLRRLSAMLVPWRGSDSSGGWLSRSSSSMGES